MTLDLDIPILSVRQPWAWAIVGPLAKDIENRTWRTSYRGRIYIHAGVAKVTQSNAALYDFAAFLKRRPDCGSHLDHLTVRELLDAMVYGAVIGTARLIECKRNHHSPWFVGPYGFMLADQQMFNEPVPMRGQLGFFRATTEEPPRCPGT